MGRVAFDDVRVVRLIDEDLVPLYLDVGSVKGVCERLNEVLPPDARQIYPNRIFSLLSRVRGQTVHEKTLETIEAAVSSADLDEDRARKTAARLSPRVVAAWQAVSEQSDALALVSQRLNLPAAVVDGILAGAGQHPRGADSRASGSSARRAVTPPDWSFQDEAVRTTLAALRASPHAKTGVVVPTGGTKTRIGLRVALSELASAAPETRILWITHRTNLRQQARAELQKMLSLGVTGLPPDSAGMLATRIDFIMISELGSLLVTTAPLLVIVDEGHHAAAKSYQPLFTTTYPLRALFLTATPNRTDGLPIGIDSVAYTITYRELAERGVILIPQFESFPVQDFDWSEDSVLDLVDVVIDRTASDFKKTLVLAPRIDRVEEFYDALIRRIDEEIGHPLCADDIGFVHGTRNSLGCSTEEFLAVFREKPRAILVSAQLLIEGFDDPAIDSVVITYPSSSLIILMQAAGRCVRYAPGKSRCFVVQARNDRLAYHFDHRWLYQEISDELRPALEDVLYSTVDELQQKVKALLEQHNVPQGQQDHLLKYLEGLSLGDICRILLCGLPYFGSKEDFDSTAVWEPILESPTTSVEFRWIFNDYCARSAELPEPTALLAFHGQRFGFQQSFDPESKWRQYATMLTSLCSARREVYGDGSRSTDGACRPFRKHGSTTWLKYVTFRFRATVDPKLVEFLADCHNADEILQMCSANPSSCTSVVKLSVPLGMRHAVALNPQQASAFEVGLTALHEALSPVPVGGRIAAATAAREVLPTLSLPFLILSRLDRFLEDGGDACVYHAEVLNTPTSVVDNASADTSKGATHEE